MRQRSKQGLRKSNDSRIAPAGIDRKIKLLAHEGVDMEKLFVPKKSTAAAPMIGPVEIESHLVSGQIEEVRCGGENYGGCLYMGIKE